MLRDPFAALSPASRRAVTLAAMGSTLVLTAVLGRLDVQLRTPPAPYGIVSFELAGSIGRAAAILDSWNTTARLHAALIQGIDYLYLLAYSTTLAALCSWASRRRDGAWRALGTALLWGQWGAACCDAVENFALIRLLLGSVWEGWPKIAFVFAAAKFALVASANVYALVGVFLRRPAGGVTG